MACKLENLSLIPRTYVKGKKSWGVSMHVIPILGRWRQVDLRTLLPSSFAYMERSRTVWALSQKKMGRWWLRNNNLYFL